jgi:diguanylate cyclase (GGDEF)-like protein/PAS domain S-box-containing protein
LEIRDPVPHPVLVSANSLLGEAISRSIIDCVNRTLPEIVPRYIERQMISGIKDCHFGQAAQEAEVIIEHEGASRWWRFIAAPILSDPGTQRVIVTMIEITEKKILEKRLDAVRQRYEAIVETAHDGIITIDANQTIRMINESAIELFGISREDAVGKNLTQLIPQQHQDKHRGYVNSFRTSAIKVRPMEGRPSITGVRTDGREFPIEITISKIVVDNEIEMTAVVRDVSVQRKLLEQLEQAANQDALTGIFNRLYGNAVLEKEVLRCRRFNRPLSIAAFDLDRFKQINDQYGHFFGDKVLTAVTKMVAKQLRVTDTFCRWGGEEFLIILPETNLVEADGLATRLCEAIASLVITGPSKSEIGVTASFGVTDLSDEDTELPVFVSRADKALYRAKDRGRNQVCTSPDLPSEPLIKG